MLYSEGLWRKRSPFLMRKEGGGNFFYGQAGFFLSEGEIEHDSYPGQLVRVGRKISCRGLRFAGGVTIL